MHNVRKEKRKVIFGLGIILLDQLIKFIVLPNGLTLINKGVFFGLKPAITLTFFGILGFLGMMGILGKKYNFPWSLILVMAGGISNLIDRIFKGGVVDFIDIKVIPVFNIADIAICVGTAFFLIDFIFKRRV